MTNNFAEWDYLSVLRALTNAPKREGRNGVTRSLFDQTLKIDLDFGFPLLTTKRMHFRSIVAELCWFLQGRTDIQYLHDHGCTIWDEWVKRDGTFGPIYGHQLRHFNGQVDQLATLIDGLRSDPYSRRHVITLWNPADLPEMALPPCHGIAIQFYVNNDERLCLAMHQRSADWFLGVPFNVASYALLLTLVAREVGRAPGRMHLRFVDAHLYENHMAAASEQLGRKPMVLPGIGIPRGSPNIFDIAPDDVLLLEYESHPAIKAEVSA